MPEAPRESGALPPPGSKFKVYIQMITQYAKFLLAARLLMALQRDHLFVAAAPRRAVPLPPSVRQWLTFSVFLLLYQCSLVYFLNFLVENECRNPLLGLHSSPPKNLNRSSSWFNHESPHAR